MEATTATPIRTIRLSTGTFDHAAKFGIVVKGFRGPKIISVSLLRDKLKEGDGIYWALKGATTLAATYSKENREATDRIFNGGEEPLRHGDLVRIEGDDRTFKLRVQGDYSDAAIFDPVEV